MKTLIILPIISLLALIAGGIFVSNHWQTTVYISPQPVVELASTDSAFVATSAKEAAAPPGEPSEGKPAGQEKGNVVPPTEDEVEEDLELKVQILIQESEKLIAKTQKFIEEEKKKAALIRAAKEKSSQIKGVYMNEFMTNYQTPVAVNTRGTIKKLLDETELDGVVIDVKEAHGPNLPNSLKKLIEEFQQKDIWVIARVVVFRDSSLVEEKPEWYLATSSEGFWLDPANPEVQDYIIDFSKKVIDFGFDELQFDYIRFPADYPGQEENYEVIRENFLKLSQSLKSYKPSIILSVDLFGYVATQYRASNIGQRLKDAGENFDYISFMLYPSHFYGGFKMGEDLKRELPALNFPYLAEDINQLVSNNPYQVILRSVLTAADYLSLFGSETKIRPWLQDFDLTADTSRGIFYDAEKVRAQIQGAEDANSAGWLLWNPSNIYTEEALK